MKYISLVSATLLASLVGCKTIKPAAEIRPESIQTPSPVTEAATPEINYSDQITWLLGYFTKSQMTHEPHSTWFYKGYDSYQPNSDDLNKLLEISKDELSIKIVMGTWCPDSRREVPRLMRILDIWQFPVDKITFIGVDNSKFSPVGDYEKLDIQRVPTIIIYKNNIEAGRIIEYPKTSLEQDMVNILTRNE